MIIISDTSPISNLFIVNRLHLLHDIYGQIIIPTAVYQELMALKSSHFDLSEIQHATWIEQRPVSDISLLKKYENIIDRGESEAIVLAHELKADLLLIDESRGTFSGVQGRNQNYWIIGCINRGQNDGANYRSKTSNG